MLYSPLVATTAHARFNNNENFLVFSSSTSIFRLAENLQTFTFDIYYGKLKNLASFTRLKITIKDYSCDWGNRCRGPGYSRSVVSAGIFSFHMSNAGGIEVHFGTFKKILSFNPVAVFGKSFCENDGFSWILMPILALFCDF